MFESSWIELKQWLLGNGQWVLFVSAAFIVSGLVKVGLRFFIGKMRALASKTETKVDNILVSALARTQGWAIFLWILFILMQDFATKFGFYAPLKFIVVLGSSFQVAMWGLAAIQSWRQNFLEKKMQQDVTAAGALNLVYMALQRLFIAILVLMSLSQLGVNISALLAGLGIGGIAVALATQNILGDLFASLLIVLDKPFVVGDYIIVGSERGTVERIGLKTTRLRALGGEELIFSNKDLLDSRLRNFKRMNQRRCEQVIGVAYETTPEQLRKIPMWIREIISREPLLQFDRCNLVRFGASSLDFEIIMFILDADYNKYADLQHEMLIQIYQKFQQEGVQIPFPVTTVYLHEKEKLRP
jgi:small-conductance mechanosensitive channel